jgi:hypothetical protein
MSKDKTETVAIRRAPKFIPFMLTGIAIGAVIAIILSLTISGSDGKTAGFITQLLVYCLGLGAGLGIAVAAIVDGLTTKNAKTAQANKVSSK